MIQIRRKQGTFLNIVYHLLRHINYYNSREDELYILMHTYIYLNTGWIVLLVTTSINKTGKMKRPFSCKCHCIDVLTLGNFSISCMKMG